MCGRYTLSTPAGRLAEEFQLNEGSVDLTPSYNVAPTQEVPRFWRRKVSGVWRCSGGGSFLRGRTTPGSGRA